MKTGFLRSRKARRRNRKQDQRHRGGLQNLAEHVDLSFPIHTSGYTLE
jgi:hypothetical protein